MKRWWHPLAYGFSLVPTPFLHLLSSLTAWLLFNVVKYRRKVIEENITRAFPKLTTIECLQYTKNFYRNLTDVLFEFLKGQSISEKELRQRVILKNPEIFEELYQKNRGVMVVMGHYTNFEWVALAMPLLVPNPTFAVYGRIKNPETNEWVVKLRERFGLKLFSMKDTYKFMLNNSAKSPLYLFMADQAPHKGKIKYRAPFFNIPTPTHIGAENLAKMCDLSMIFIHVKRIKRGFYTINPELIAIKPNEYPNYQLTDMHVAALEKLIKEEPANWLWSHKRWKNL